ncbi:hypothetical protein BHUM_05275 [Candidatus Burkholderia humilis]|nr:hypothetical protein BHUM_05275 [Candidatus Burkholderia humilis]
MTRLKWMSFGAAIACAAYAGHANAQAYRDVAPLAPPSPAKPHAPEPPPEPSDDSQHIAIQTLRGIPFHSAMEPGASVPSAASVDNGAISATGVPFLDASFLAQFSADIGKPLTFARLADIRRAVAALS